MNVATIVVVGWGNASRGDDALGPLLCDWLEARAGGGDVEVLQDFQLQVEHALDLVGRRLVLFVDAEAAADGVAPGCSLRRVSARRDASHSTHALSAEAVLAVYQQVRGEEPPPAFLLAVRGVGFELGEPLSAFAEASLAAAQELLQCLLAQPNAAVWERLGSCVDVAPQR